MHSNFTATRSQGGLPLSEREPMSSRVSQREEYFPQSLPAAPKGNGLLEKMSSLGQSSSVMYGSSSVSARQGQDVSTTVRGVSVGGQMVRLHLGEGTRRVEPTKGSYMMNNNLLTALAPSSGSNMRGEAQYTTEVVRSSVGRKEMGTTLDSRSPLGQEEHNDSTGRVFGAGSNNVRSGGGDSDGNNNFFAAIEQREKELLAELLERARRSHDSGRVSGKELSKSMGDRSEIVHKKEKKRSHREEAEVKRKGDGDDALATDSIVRDKKGKQSRNDQKEKDEVERFQVAEGKDSAFSKKRRDKSSESSRRSKTNKKEKKSRRGGGGSREPDNSTVIIHHEPISYGSRFDTDPFIITGDFNKRAAAAVNIMSPLPQRPPPLPPKSPSLPSPPLPVSATKVAPTSRESLREVGRANVGPSTSDTPRPYVVVASSPSRQQQEQQHELREPFHIILSNGAQKGIGGREGGGVSSSVNQTAKSHRSSSRRRRHNSSRSRGSSSSSDTDGSVGAPNAIFVLGEEEESLLAKGQGGGGRLSDHLVHVRHGFEGSMHIPSADQSKTKHGDQGMMARGMPADDFGVEELYVDFVEPPKPSRPQTQTAMPTRRSVGYTTNPLVALSSREPFSFDAGHDKDRNVQHEPFHQSDYMHRHYIRNTKAHDHRLSSGKAKPITAEAASSTLRGSSQKEYSSNYATTPVRLHLGTGEKVSDFADATFSGRNTGYQQPQQRSLVYSKAYPASTPPAREGGVLVTTATTAADKSKPLNGIIINGHGCDHQYAFLAYSPAFSPRAASGGRNAANDGAVAADDDYNSNTSFTSVEETRRGRRRGRVSRGGGGGHKREVQQLFADTSMGILSHPSLTIARHKDRLAELEAEIALLQKKAEERRERDKAMRSATEEMRKVTKDIWEETARVREVVGLLREEVRWVTMRGGEEAEVEAGGARGRHDNKGQDVTLRSGSSYYDHNGSDKRREDSVPSPPLGNVNTLSHVLKMARLALNSSLRQRNATAAAGEQSQNLKQTAGGVNTTASTGVFNTQGHSNTNNTAHRIDFVHDQSAGGPIEEDSLLATLITAYLPNEQLTLAMCKMALIRTQNKDLVDLWVAAEKKGLEAKARKKEKSSRRQSKKYRVGNTVATIALADRAAAIAASVPAGCERVGGGGNDDDGNHSAGLLLRPPSFLASSTCIPDVVSAEAGAFVPTAAPSSASSEASDAHRFERDRGGAGEGRRRSSSDRSRRHSTQEESQGLMVAVSASSFASSPSPVSAALDPLPARPPPPPLSSFQDPYRELGGRDAKIMKLGEKSEGNKGLSEGAGDHNENNGCGNAASSFMSISANSVVGGSANDNNVVGSWGSMSLSSSSRRRNRRIADDAGAKANKNTSVVAGVVFKVGATGGLRAVEGGVPRPDGGLQHSSSLSERARKTIDESASKGGTKGDKEENGARREWNNAVDCDDDDNEDEDKDEDSHDESSDEGEGYLNANNNSSRSPHQDGKAPTLDSHNNDNPHPSFCSRSMRDLAARVELLAPTAEECLPSRYQRLRDLSSALLNEKITFQNETREWRVLTKSLARLLAIGVVPFAEDGTGGDSEPQRATSVAASMTVTETELGGGEAKFDGSPKDQRRSRQEQQQHQNADRQASGQRSSLKQNEYKSGKDRVGDYAADRNSAAQKRLEKELEDLLFNCSTPSTVESEGTSSNPSRILSEGEGTIQKDAMRSLMSKEALESKIDALLGKHAVAATTGSGNSKINSSSLGVRRVENGVENTPTNSLAASSSAPPSTTPAASAKGSMEADGRSTSLLSIRHRRLVSEVVPLLEKESKTHDDFMSIVDDETETIINLIQHVSNRFDERQREMERAVMGIGKEAENRDSQGGGVGKHTGDNKDNSMDAANSDVKLVNGGTISNSQLQTSAAELEGLHKLLVLPSKASLTPAAILESYHHHHHHDCHDLHSKSINRSSVAIDSGVVGKKLASHSTIGNDKGFVKKGVVASLLDDFITPSSRMSLKKIRDEVQKCVKEDTARIGAAIDLSCLLKKGHKNGSLTAATGLTAPESHQTRSSQHQRVPRDHQLLNEGALDWADRFLRTCVLKEAITLVFAEEKLSGALESSYRTLLAALQNNKAQLLQAGVRSSLMVGAQIMAHCFVGSGNIGANVVSSASYNSSVISTTATLTNKSGMIISNNGKKDVFPSTRRKGGGLPPSIPADLREAFFLAASADDVGISSYGLKLLLTLSDKGILMCGDGAHHPKPVVLKTPAAHRLQSRLVQVIEEIKTLQAELKGAEHEKSRADGVESSKGKDVRGGRQGRVIGSTPSALNRKEERALPQHVEGGLRELIKNTHSELGHTQEEHHMKEAEVRARLEELRAFKVALLEEKCDWEEVKKAMEDLMRYYRNRRRRRV